MTKATPQGAPTAGKQTDDNRLALRFGTFETVRCFQEIGYIMNLVQKILQLSARVIFH